MAVISGNGVVSGTEAADQITGGEGNDSLVGGAGPDVLNGGAGIDFAEYATSPAGIDASIAAGVVANDGFGAADTLVSIEGVVGSLLNDRLVGSAVADVLLGLDGVDTIDGGAGNDLLRGGAGDDGITGGEGADTAFYSGGFRGYAVAASGANVRIADSRSSGDGTDSVVGVEIAVFADGRLVFDPNDPAAQVVRLYEAALDRLPDQGGLNFWTGAVQGGQPLSSLAAGFLASPEFQARFGGAGASNAAFVDQLYLNVLGRAGEQAGRDFWAGTLNSGAASRADVLAAFSESAENKAGTAALVQQGIWDRSEAATQVARLYDTVFGRAPDLAGLTSSKDAIESGSATLAQVAESFTNSAEFRGQYGTLGNRDFVNALYLNTLDRPGDQAGLDGWTNALNSGAASRASVVLAFSESAEHVALTAANIQSDAPGQYGVLFA